MRGPALNGVNIVGCATKRAMRAGSVQRVGSNTSASAPHSAALRCVRSGRYVIVVRAGM